MTTAKRSRQSTPRSRNGCDTCKKRHYKCTEDIPECRQCIVGGWKCPGYRPSDSISTASLLAVDISRYTLAFKVPGSQYERRSLHHFSNIAAADMSGPLSGEFWSRTILQRCQHETPVRHAAVALGQIHVEYIATPRDSDFTPSGLTVEAYGKAVKSLRNYMGSKEDPSRSVVLMCSALFFCFDLMRSEFAAGLRHLRSGLTILKTWRRETLTATRQEVEEQDELLAVFARMDLEATIFDEDRVPLLRLEGVDMLEHPLLHQTKEESWHRGVLMLSHAALLFLVEGVPYKAVSICQVPQAVQVQRKQLIDQFDLWERVAEDLKSHAGMKHDSDNGKRQAFLSATVQCRIIRLLLYHSLRNDPDTVTITFDDEATKLLEEAEAVLCPHESACRTFFLHAGVIAPMFLLALKTSRSDVRQRAVNVLRRLEGHREGFYDARTMVKTFAALEWTAAEAEGALDLEHTAEAVMNQASTGDVGEEGLGRTFKLLTLAVQGEIV